MSNQTNPEQKIVLSLGDLQEVLNYISTRPYAEVFKVVDILRKAKTLESVLSELTNEESKPTQETSVTTEV